jgi:hypothetical protein
MVDLEVNSIFAAAFLGHPLAKDKDCIFFTIGNPSILLGRMGGLRGREP